MRKLYLCLIALVCSLGFSASLHAQVGVGTTAPNTSAMLDVSSTKKGFLPPRMTSGQRDSIAQPVAGLVLWCSNCGTSGEMDVYNGTTWININGSAATPAPPSTVYAVGQSYLGGIIAYVFQPGDSAYVAGENHGLIAATGDFGSSVWIISQSVVSNASDTGLCQGLLNTNLIIAAQNAVNSQSVGSYAAAVCKAVTTGGGTWYLPDSSELRILYKNQVAIGGFTTTGNVKSPPAYWSSNTILFSGTENTQNAMALDFSNGTFSAVQRISSCHVRPIRKF